MPEGDTLFRAATTLRKALLGRRVTGFETSVDAVQAMAQRHGVEGRVISAIEARGKHLLITLSPAEPTEDATNLVLRTHLRMTGSWHLYRPGEAWRKPARLATRSSSASEGAVW